MATQSIHPSPGGASTPEYSTPGSTASTTDESPPNGPAAKRDGRFTSPIAICGLGVRLPGGVHDGDSFWNLLVNGRDARGPIPASRYNIGGFDDGLGGKDAVKTRHGYFLDGDLSSLDASFFSMTRAELEKCDPQQRQLLEVTRECLEDAGETAYRGKDIGCYVGNFGHDWMEMSLREPQHTPSYTVLGYSDMLLANRVSYEYDLRGPSVVVKTACSASLVALHDACRALQAGDISGAVVGGTSLILAPTLTSAFFSEGILSPEASCKTFDAAADGFARAEGIAAIYIKRVDDALRDGNPIRAVIRGTGSSSDGRSMGIMSPNSEAHEALMRQVYSQSGLDPRATAFVECHGTGTATGDPIETRAVGEVFGERGVFIGSVKPNVGHSEGCSGLASLIKGVLALEHSIIPPNIKFTTPNPKIPFSEKKLVVPVEPTRMPADRAERISVNSFGIGGSNAHVIIESQPQFLGRRFAGFGAPSVPVGVEDPHLLLFSANNQTSLQRQVAAYHEYVAQHPTAAADVAYTLAVRREKLPQRAYSISQNDRITETSGFAKAPASPPTVTMIFSGQGSQWASMGSRLIESSDSFRSDLAAMDAILQSLKKPPSWSIIEELQKPAEISRINSAELAQPLCTALQVALFHELRRLGTEPAAVVGHSSGEIAAAYAAGLISLEHAVTAAYYRGYVAKDAGHEGGMAAVGLSTANVSRFLRPGVRVACENSPSSTTVSGDGDALAQVLADIKAEWSDAFARKLRVDVAYHSHHMVPLGDEYFRLLQAEDMSIPAWSGSSVPPLFLSSVTCEPLGDSSYFGPQYWVDNLTSPVRFGPAVTKLLGREDRDPVFLEVGPHSTLAGPLREICATLSRPCHYVTSQYRGRDGETSLLSAIGRLYQEGVDVDFQALHPRHGKAIAGLPTYPWDHSGSFWYESRLSSAWRRRRFPHHCLLGSRSLESPDFAPSWRNMLSLDDAPWLADHRIRRDVVFPLAGYIAMAGEAIRQATGVNTSYRLRHVEARRGLVLPADAKPVELVTVLHRQDADKDSWFDFSIASCRGDSWLVHCSGEASALDAASISEKKEVSKLPRKLNSSKFYEAMARMGVVFGPEFQCLADITSSTTEPLAEALVTSTKEAFKSFALHPTIIDACIQLLIVADARGLCRNLDQLRVPVVVGDIKVASGPKSATMQATARDMVDGVECTSLGDDTAAVRMSGLQLAPLDVEPETPTHPLLADVHAGARLQWLPDLDFADVTQLFDKPVRSRTEITLEQRLALLCVLESSDQLAGLAPCQPHFEQYRKWLGLQVRSAEDGEYALVGDGGAAYEKLSRPQRHALLDETYAEILRLPGSHPLATGLKRICDNSHRIFVGEEGREHNLALDVLMQDGLLTQIYDAVSFGYGPFVRLLAHSRPNLRILEVGAGTGGTTELTLRSVVDSSSFPPYATYTFTDVSAGFFPQARARFAYAPNMEFKTFDITRSGLEQGLDAASYDLILAPNVVHATPSLQNTLANLRPLLKPDGYLLLTELCALVKAPNYVFGNFVGWWLGAADHRPWEPYVQPERWDADLHAAGYSGVDAAVSDQDAPYRLAATLVSRPRVEAVTDNMPGRVTLLCEYPDEGIASRIYSFLSTSGWDVEVCRLGDQMPSDGLDIISCLGLESKFFDVMTETSFAAFQGLLRHISSGTKILWLTHPFQVKCKDPRSAQTLGVARSARTELSLPLFTLEIDPDEPQFDKLVCGVFDKIRVATGDGTLHTDKEFVVDNGTVCLGRYHPFDLKKEPATQDSVTLNPDATYLLVGGAGGLGRSIATWLVEHGAADLTFFSRSLGTSAESETLFTELRSMGCAVHAVAGSVQTVGDVEKAVAAAGKPVRGVFQLAMVLEDAPLLHMKYSEWVDVVRPKVDGTWNLHHALLAHPLDFFWLASSILSTVDQPGQANYLATGTFLEAFCQYRHTLGLPASVLNICPIDGVGFVSENPQARKNMRAQGIHTLGESQFLDFLALGLGTGSPSPDLGPGPNPLTPWSNCSQIVMGLRSELDLADPANRASWRHDRRMGIYHNVHLGTSEDPSTAAADSAALKIFLARVHEDADADGSSSGLQLLQSRESTDFLALEIGRTIHELMLKPADDEVDIALTLAQIGLDSLMAIELQRWSRQVLGVATSVLEIMGSASLRELGALVAVKLAESVRG